MTKIFQLKLETCDDCQDQLVFAESLYCCKLQRNIEISDEEDFPEDCPLEDD